MKISLILLFVSILVLTRAVSAQTPVHDTVRLNQLRDRFWKLFYKDQTKAITPLNEAFSSGLLDRNPEYLDDFKFNLSVYYNATGNPKKAKKLIAEALRLSREQKDSWIETNCNNELAIIYSEEGNLKKALPYYLKVLKYAQDKKNVKSQIACYINIAQVYYRLQLDKQYKTYLSKAEKLAKKENDHQFLADIYGHYFEYYIDLKDTKSMLIYLKKAESEILKLDNLHQTAFLENAYGKYYMETKNFPEARKHFRKSFALYKQNSMIDQQAMVLIDLGKMNLLQHQYDSAISYAQKAIDLSYLDKNDFRLYASYGLLIETYELKKHYKSALEILKTKNQLQDSISGLSVKNRINELMVVHETEQKNLENQLLKGQKEKSELKSEYLELAIIGLLIIALLLAAAYYFYYKHKKSNLLQKQLELEQKAFRAQMNPHFIFNSLNSIQRLYIEGKEDMAGDYLSDFSHLLRSILDNSGKNLISLEEELRITHLYLGLETRRTDNQFDYQIETESELDLKTKLPPLIFQPYLENAIWHGVLPNSGQKGTITLKITKSVPNILKCIISDNGVGYFTSLGAKKEFQKSSKGMEITADRIGGNTSVSIEEIPTGGTKITLLITTQP